MDADLQHPPEITPQLMKEIKNGADIAIASRYVKKGGIEGLGFFRGLVSKGATYFTNFFTEVKDLFLDFFAFKREVIDKTELKPEGYKICLKS
jgi:dolichol-phosphate mannosyltransferase